MISRRVLCCCVSVLAVAILANSSPDDKSDGPLHIGDVIDRAESMREPATDDTRRSLHRAIADAAGWIGAAAEALLPDVNQYLREAHEALPAAASFPFEVSTQAHRRPRPVTPMADEGHAIDDWENGATSARFILQSVSAVHRWWNGPQEEEEETSLPPLATSSNARAAVWESHDALAQLHLRAAEEAAEHRRNHHATNAKASRVAAESEDLLSYSDSEWREDNIDAVKQRSDRLLVSLLRWRRLQQSHHAPPILHPDHLPDYAKRFAMEQQHRREPQRSTHRRGFAAQQTQSFEQPTKYDYCHDGVVAYSQSSNFSCRTLSGALANFSALQASLQPPAVRSTCAASPASTRTCICPRDSFVGRTVFGDVICFWRDINCSVTRLDPPACGTPKVSVPLSVPSCISIPRRAIFAFSANVSCRFKWPNPVDYAFYGIALVQEPAPTQNYVVLNFTNRSQAIVRNLTGYPVAAYGSYRALSDSVFLYAAEDETSVMPLTRVHPAVGQFALFARPLNFNLLSDRSMQQSVVLGSAGYVPGTITGTQPTTFAIDFSSMPEDYVTANRVYLEVGVRAGTASLSPESVIASSFTVDFSDVPIPPERNRNPSNTATIVIAVVVSVVVAGVIAAAIGAYCYVERRRDRLMKEDDVAVDDDDDAAHTKKTKPAATR